MINYFCEFPGCEYKTEYRSKINYHHIIPVECGGINADINRIYLCPNCHLLIFVVDAKYGNHTFKYKDSIIINRWLQSTCGKILEYIDSNGNICYKKSINNIK